MRGVSNKHCLLTFFICVSEQVKNAERVQLSEIPLPDLPVEANTGDNKGVARMLNIYSRSGSVVECLTPDLGAAGSSLTGVTALWSLSKTHLS